MPVWDGGACGGWGATERTSPCVYAIGEHGTGREGVSGGGLEGRHQLTSN